jgi:hypothetical protein
MSAISEEFIRQYLRLNAYFGIDNFIIHAADDPERITANGKIGNYTETDFLGVRLPYSSEMSGQLFIANDPPLVEGINEKIDIVIGEVKTGGQDKPNPTWKHPERIYPKEYILKFVGLYKDGKEISSIAKYLSENYKYEDDRARIRYIVFSESENKHYKGKGVTYITYEHIIDFLTELRGQSWTAANIGVSSLHNQWPALLQQIFEIANDCTIEMNIRKTKIKEILDG